MRHVLAAASLACLLVLPSCTSADEGGGTPPRAPEPPPPPPPAAARTVDAGATTGGVSEADFKALHALRTDAPPALRGHAIELAGGRAYLSLPDTLEPPLPGIVVIQEWWGLNDNIRHWADRLAAEGYAALAVDLYDGIVATTPDEAMAAMRKADPARMTEIVKAAHRFLVEDARVKAPRTGSIGWCFGGHWSLRLAMAEPELDACVMYYGRPVVEVDQLKSIKAPVLAIFGSKDTSIPGKTLTEFDLALKAAGVHGELFMFPAEHAFANPSNPRYDEANAAQAWKQVKRFFDQNLRFRSLD